MTLKGILEQKKRKKILKFFEVLKSSIEPPSEYFFGKVRKKTKCYNVVNIIVTIKPSSQFPGLFKRKFSIVRVGIFWKFLYY